MPEEESLGDTVRQKQLEALDNLSLPIESGGLGAVTCDQSVAARARITNGVG